MNGIIYRGPSLIDGTDIVVVAVAKSGNSKTGNMVQTFILRADMDPRAANQTGADFSICGNCPHRGVSTGSASVVTDGTSIPLAKQRTCYVNLGQGVLGVYRKFERGGYKHLSDSEVQHLSAGRMVRLGTYGDPAAVPASVWERLVASAKGWTGYSHQHGMEGASVRPDLTMTSADSLEQAEAAWSRGERTFRVVSDQREIINQREVMCPASAEAGRKTTCDSCALCNGTSSKSRKSVAIVAHGNGKKYFDIKVPAAA